MEDEKRVTIRLSGPLARLLARKAEQAGVSFSEQVRRMIVASHPHLGVLEDVGEIIAVGKVAAEHGEPYAPYLRNCERRLEDGLEALKTFDNLAVAWRQEAEAELTAALAYIRQTAQQHQWTGEIVQFFQKTLPTAGETHESKP
jgi:predicted DNA binding CopG/RHH family protein